MARRAARGGRPEDEKAARERERGEQFWIELSCRPVLAKNTVDGIRAVSGRTVVTAGSFPAKYPGKPVA